MIFSEITSKCLLKADDSNPRNSDSAAIRCNDGANTFTDITDIGSDPKGVYSNSTVFWVSDDELLVTYWYCVYTDNWLMTANTDLCQVRIKIDRSKLLK